MLGRVWRGIAGCIGAVLLLVGCDGTSGYSQSSPDAVIQTAKLMVERGEAAKLPMLFYAENDDMRSLYRRAGKLLGNLQELGKAVKAKFPGDVAKLEKQATDAAKKGQATSLLSAITGNQQSPFGRRKNQTPDQAAADANKQQEAINAAIQRLFADPYAFLEDATGRMSTTYVSDDLAAVLWDKQPIMPPVGLTMKRTEEKGKTKWAIVLPLNLPGLAKFTPRTKAEYQVLGSLMKTLDNVVVDLTKDITEGRLRTLDAVSRKAGEKAFIPAAMTFYAYSRAVKEREKAAAKPATTPAPGKG